jgi:hypothetical protein
MRRPGDVPVGVGVRVAQVHHAQARIPEPQLQPRRVDEQARQIGERGARQMRLGLGVQGGLLSFGGS